MDRETQKSGDWIGRRPMHATDDGLSSPLAATFFAADRWRRWRGGWLDALGLGPRETPWRSVDVAAGVRLRCYDGAREPDAVPVLLVPAPIKQPYIWDLLPRISVVRRCLEAGLRVYLAAWRAPEPGQRDGGLAEYADQFLAACLRVIAAESHQPRPFLVGHSLGGTLAALFASLHPERVGGLVLLEAPLKFGRDAGAFAPLLAASPPAGAIVAALGGVPGSFLDAVAVAAAPESFLWWPWRDAVASGGDADATTTHLLVRRWTLDEVPLSARLFEEVAEQLYRADAFAQGTLRIGGRLALPARLVEPAGRGCGRPREPARPVRCGAGAARGSGRSLAEAEALHHRASLAHALDFACVLDQLRDDPTGVLSHAAGVRRLAEEQAIPFWSGRAGVLEGWAVGRTGAPDAGAATIVRALDALLATGVRFWRPYHLALLADVEGRAHRHGEALARVDEALRQVAETGERWFEAELHRLRGELALRSGGDASAANAEAAFHAALGLARRRAARMWELRAAVSLARLWAERSERGKAHDLLAPVYGWFTEGFDTPDLRDARACCSTQLA